MHLRRWIGQILVVAAAVLATAGCSTVDEALRAKAERTVELEHALSPGSQLSVSTTNGSIEVTGQETDRVYVIATIVARGATKDQARELAEQIVVRLEPRAGGLQVEVEKPAPADSKSVRISYEIIVPRQTTVDIASASGSVEMADLIGNPTARTASGSIEASRITGSIRFQSSSGSIWCSEVDQGDVQLESASGSVRLTDGSSLGVCQLGAMSGSVTAQRLDARTLRMNSSSSSVTLRDAQADLIHLHSGSGSISAQEISCEQIQAESTSGAVSVAFNPDASGDVIAGLKSGSGGVSVVMPRDFGGQVDLRASTGTVHMRQPITPRGKPGKDHISGTLGTGSGSLLVRSTSGAIRVR